jgi:hypothetical protein
MPVTPAPPPPPRPHEKFPARAVPYTCPLLAMKSAPNGPSLNMPNYLPMKKLQHFGAGP